MPRFSWPKLKDYIRAYNQHVIHPIKNAAPWVWRTASSGCPKTMNGEKFGVESVYFEDIEVGRVDAKPQLYELTEAEIIESSFTASVLMSEVSTLPPPMSTLSLAMTMRSFTSSTLPLMTFLVLTFVAALLLRKGITLRWGRNPDDSSAPSVGNSAGIVMLSAEEINVYGIV
jgi:hypothetical protein